LGEDATRPNSPDAPVSAFNAHLRLTPQAPGEYRVVLTFHLSDGQLCEAALTPLEASILLSEIAHVLEDGDRRAGRSEAGANAI
jgi:hypothetical protein